MNPEQKEAARQRALKFWADPVNRAKRLAQTQTPEIQEIRRKAMLGNKHAEGCGPNSGSFYKGFKHSYISRKKIGDACRGPKSHLWQGGISKEHEDLRKSIEYKMWREAVFVRDQWTCVFCGSKGRVQADHIKPFAQFPELRFAIDNGRTLCVDCHKNTDSYGVNVRWINRN